MNISQKCTIFIFCLVFLCISSYSVTINSDYQGWIKADGSSNGAVNGNNTFTGITNNGFYNSWANFDLSGITGPVTSVKLELYTTLWQSTSNFNIGIYDVSTSLAVLSANTGGVSAYNDLFSGNMYGSAVVTQGSIVTVTLSAQAIANVSAALGGTFRVGFTNLTLAGQSTSLNVGVYTNANTSSWPRLTIETTPVPEAGTMSLMAIGLCILAFCKLHR